MGDRKYNATFSGFRRLQNFPLDPTTRFKKLTDFTSYLVNDKTAYHGQMVAVYEDPTVENNTVYIIKQDTEKGGLTYEKIASYAKVMEIYGQLTSAYDTFVGEINNNFETFKTDFRSETDKKLSDFEKTVTERLDKLDVGTQEQLDEFKESTNKTLSELDARLDSFYGWIDSTEAVERLDSLKEVAQWISENEDYLDTMVGVHNRLQEQINTVIGQLGDFKTKVENAGYVTRDQVVDIVGGTDLEGALKTFSFNFDTSQSTPLEIRAVYTGRSIFNGCVIQTIRVCITKPSSGEDQYFSIYLTDNSGKKVILVPEKYYIDPNEPEEGYCMSIDFSEEMTEYEVNKYIEGEYTLIADARTGTGCAGTVYINYFKKVTN